MGSSQHLVGKKRPATSSSFRTEICIQETEIRYRYRVQPAKHLWWVCFRAWCVSQEPRGREGRKGTRRKSEADNMGGGNQPVRARLCHPDTATVPSASFAVRRMLVVRKD